MELKSEINHLSATEKELVIEAPAELVGKEFNRTYKELGRVAKVPGFRPGKVPRSVLRQKFTREARETVASQLLPQMIRAAVSEHKLALVSDPKIQDLSVKEGQPLKVKARVEVLPLIESIQYKGLHLRKRVQAVSSADVDRWLEELRQQYAELVPVVGRPADNGDFVTLKLSTQIASPTATEKPSSSEPETVEVRIGDEEDWPEISEKVRGMEVGETRRFRISYPGDHHHRQLAGQEVDHEATVEALRIKEVPPLDDEFVKTLGEEYETLADFRRELEQRLEESHNKQAEEALRNAALDKLIESHPIDVPLTLVKRRLESRLKGLAHSLIEQGVDPDSADIDWETIAQSQRKEATRDIRAKVLLQRIADLEEITVTDAELRAEINRLASQFQESPGALERRLTKEGSLDSIKDEVRNRKALEVVVEAADVVREVVQGEG